MISQRCPKCRSSNIRRGYRPTPLVIRMFGIYRLLCDKCNLQFVGFAVPGTVPKPGQRRKKKRRAHNGLEQTRTAVAPTSYTEAKSNPKAAAAASATSMGASRGDVSSGAKADESAPENKSEFPTTFSQQADEFKFDLQTEDSVMKSISLSLAITFFCAGGAALTTLAQTQQGATPPPESTSAANNSSQTTSTAMGQMGIGNYLLGPGDVLSMRVFRYQQFDGEVEVDSNGTIVIPLVDQPIIARCRRAQEVQREVAEALKKYIRNPQVSLRVKERRSRPNAVVAGAVRRPEQFQMLRRVRLLELLAYTGGVTEQASGSIQVFHTEAEMCPDPNEPILPAPTAKTTDDALQVPFTLYNINDLRQGKEEANPYIRPGDIVLVQEAPPVYVTGAVYSPQGVFLRNNATLMRAIAQVGGLRREAKQEKITIYRQKPGASEPEIITANYAAIKKNKAPDIVLQPYDVIDVEQDSVFAPRRLGDTLRNMAVGGIGSAITTLPLRIIY